MQRVPQFPDTQTHTELWLIKDWCVSGTTAEQAGAKQTRTRTTAWPQRNINKINTSNAAITLAYRPIRSLVCTLPKVRASKLLLEFDCQVPKRNTGQMPALKPEHSVRSGMTSDSICHTCSRIVSDIWAALSLSLSHTHPRTHARTPARTPARTHARTHAPTHTHTHRQIYIYIYI